MNNRVTNFHKVKYLEEDASAKNVGKSEEDEISYAGSVGIRINSIMIQNFLAFEKATDVQLHRE